MAKKKKNMKRTLLVIITILALALPLFGCDRTYTSDPAVEAYLNGGISAKAAMDAVKTAHYTVTETQQNKAGEELGKQVSVVKLDLSDDNYVVSVTKNASGAYVTTGQPKQSSVTIARGGEKYVYTKVEDGKTSTRDVDAEFVLNYVTAQFYHYNDAYYEGGLYYGDYFMLAIYKYPQEFFFVDEQADLCVFHQQCITEKQDTGKVQLVQQTKVNRLGLLVFNSERYISQLKDFELVSELNATYTYKTEG